MLEFRSALATTHPTLAQGGAEPSHMFPPTWRIIEHRLALSPFFHLYFRATPA
jgi:hypothetical protein